jgi:hypothetical protein
VSRRDSVVDRSSLASWQSCCQSQDVRLTQPDVVDTNTISLHSQSTVRTFHSQRNHASGARSIYKQWGICVLWS